MVEYNSEKQGELAEAISNLYQSLLIAKIADLKAELVTSSIFPDESTRQTLTTAYSLIFYLGSEAMKRTPEVNEKLMLDNDIAIKGWSVSVATAVDFLLQRGKYQEAKQLLSEEVPKFKRVVQRWANYLINKEPEEKLKTAYRFDVPLFKDYITPERVQRIVQISTQDKSLTQETIREKKGDSEVYLQLSSCQEKNDQHWINRQIAFAEYLDTLSELSARLDSLQDVTAIWETQGIKNSKQLLPPDSQPGLYILDIPESR
ncbi:MAG: hypothetical protein AB4062_05695 [Crocosphaera sp.]